MWSFLEVLRPFNCIMASAGVIAGGLLGIHGFSLPLLIAAFIAFLITGAGNVINDILDLESDRINRPTRPIPSGRMGAGSAKAFTVLLFAAGVFLASTINWITFLLAIINSIVLLVYSMSLQNKILVGNIAVAYLVGSTFLFGGAAVNNLTLPLILMLLSGLTTFSREIVKDLEDLEGDRKSFLKRMATRMKDSFADRFRVGVHGIKLRYKTIYAILLASFGLWLSVIVSLVPYVWEIFGIAYLVVVIPADAIFIFGSYILIRRRKYKIVSRLIKAGMILGLAAFLVGSVF